MTDIHKRLMTYADACLADRRTSTTSIAKLVKEGADEIQTLRAENSVMREALQNIAKLDYSRSAVNSAAFNAHVFAETAMNSVSGRQKP